ncbi:MAG: restriction endonuclease subunit S [Gordonia sp. (in: high G+C Gram-positive bacteria)]
MVRLGDQLANYDSARRPIKSSDREAGNVPYLGASGVVDYVSGSTHSGTYLCVSEDGENLRSRKTPIAWVQEGRFWANNHVHILGGASRPRLKFFACALEGANISAYLTGSTQPKLSQAALSSVLIPDIGEGRQEEIGEILLAFDDKIAANQSILRLSDDLLRAEFNQLELSSEWTVGSISAEHKSKVEAHTVDRETTFLGLEHLDRRLMWVGRSGTGDAVTSTKSRFRRGDTLFGKLRPYFHKVVVAPEEGVCSTDMLVIRPVRSELSLLVGAVCSSDAVVAAAVQHSNGTRMPRAKWIDIAACPAPDPNTPEVARFVAVADAVAHRCWAAVAENQMLARTRDELLPLLFDGRISVSEAERVIKSVR